MPASNNPIQNTNPLAPSLGDDELSTGGLLEQATLDSSSFSNSGNSEPVGNSFQSKDIDELPPLEVIPLSQEDPDTLFRGAAPSIAPPPVSRRTPQQFQQEATTVFDALTGTTSSDLGLGDSTSAAPIEFADSVTLSDLMTPSEMFTILAEGRVVVAEGGDFDGDPLNPVDDARIYAGNGFNFRRTPILPAQLDAEGNPVLDGDGNPVLISNAVSVAANYAVARAKDNPYSNLTPPQVVEAQTVAVPDFEQIKAVELGSRLSEDDTIIEYRPRRRDLDTAAEWQENFPPAGTVDAPTIVRIAQGGLRVPDGVDLRNTIIIAETGGIRFEGENHKLDNVVLIAEQKAINLGKAHVTNSSILAKRTVRMDSQARFSGRNVLANGDAEYGLRLDGSTTSTDAENELTVIAQGRLVYNSVSDTRARLVAGQTIRFNTPSLLVGSVHSKGDIRFTQDITVVAAPAGPLPDTVAPVLNAGLSNDTGRDDADGITSDPSISGVVIDDGEVGGLVARFANGLSTEFVDVSSSLQADGSFNFTPAQLATIYGGELPDGTLVLQLLAQDSWGNLSQPVQMIFELDRVAPEAEAPDLVGGGTSGDGYGTTNAEIVRFSIDAEIGSQIRLTMPFEGDRLVAEGVATEATTVLAAEGLEEGYLDIVATVIDAAGNTATSDYLSFIVDREAHGLSVDNLTDGSTIEEGARLQGSIAGSRSEVASLSYQFEGMPAVDIPLNQDRSFDVAIDAAGLVDGPQTLTVTVVDNAGNESAIAVQVTIAGTVAPALTAGLSNDTGRDDADGITSDPSVSGAVADDREVSGLVARFAEGLNAEFVDVSSSLQADGSFSFTTTQLETIYGGELPDGALTLQLRAQDSSGNLSEPVQMSFELDRVAPDAETPELVDGGISGDGYGTTNAESVRFSIDAEVGSQIQLFLYGQLIAEGVATEGTTILTAGQLEEGYLDITAIVTDAAGNTAESDYLSFIVDREAHELTVDNLTDGSTIEEGARLQGGIAGLSSEVASLSYQFDGMPAIDIPLNRDKSFDVEIDATGLVDGPQTLTVSVVDNAGNESTISVDVTIAVTGDIEPPTITAELLVDTGESDSDGLTNQAGITGSVIDESAISALRVGFSGTSEFVDVIDSLNSDGTFVLSAEQLEQINGGELPDGNYTVQIVAVDSEGNVADPVEVSFVLDTSGPVVNLIAPIADADVSATARAVGSVDATAISTQIAVNGGDSRELVLDGGGGFDTLLQTAPLSEGANQVTVTATDLAGNQTEALVEFRVAPDFIVGPNAGQGWAMASDDGIQLSERDSFVVQASQALDIPLAAGSRTLRFDLEANFDTSDAGAIEDQLLIYLVDPATGETLLGNGETGTAVLSLVGERAEFTAGLVRFNSGTVEIDLTGLTGVDRAQLVVQLVNADGDTGSTARLSNMVVDIEPDGEGQQVIETTDAIADIAGGLDIDSLTVAPADDVNVQVRNVRLDAETGLYTAQVRIRNRGEETLGRQVAVVFDDLPAGVQLVNASGVDRDGNPYINLQNAIRAGGLETGRNSDFVTISFENADLLRFGINPTVFLGDGNQSPVFEVIPPLEVMPGGRVELPLVATDADGDVVTFRIEPNGSLPKGSLSGDRLVFQPQLDELGTYTFTLIATDGSATVRQEVTLNVVPDPITTTRLSGTIASTLTDPETGADLNLGNVRVALGELETVTDADGSFTLDLPTGFSGGEVLKVYGDSIDGNYPVIAEAVASALGQEGIAGVNNVLARPIYLSPIDPGDGQSVDPMDDTVITTANLPGATLTIDAGSLKSPDGSGQLADYTGTVSITQVPVDRLPASLPPTLSPDVVVLVQAGGVVFETPAALVLPNSADYAPGTEMELYGIDSETGEFEVVGTGVVSADGSVIETTNGGVDDSGWYFFAPATAGSSIAQADIDFNLGVGRRRQSTPVAGTSAVDLHAGELTEEHQLVGYYSQGVNRSLQLSYDSSRANPTASVAFGRKDIGASSADDYLTARLRLELGGFEYSLPNRSIGGSASSQHVWRLPDTGSGQTVGGSIQANLQNLETGAYRYSVESGVQRRVGSEFVGSVDLTSGELIVINGVDSLLGAGWGIAGTQEIVATSGGAVLLIDGDGTELLFTEPVSNGAGGMLFESPNGDYSTLEQLSDGTFRRTTKDQTVYDFNADNQLISVTDRNGNIHRHNYDSQGRLVSMVDPVGLETTLSYGSDGKVKEIVDPVGRTTRLKHDSKGNLIQIVDPDGSSRSFQYDRQRNLTAEIDKRGFRQEVEYNADGQIVARHRQDGSTSRYQSAQSSIATSNYSGDPASAAVASIFGSTSGSSAQPVSTYTDSLGNVTQIGLNDLGNPTSVVNGVGRNSASFSYDQSNNLSTVRKPGYTTKYTYDERGNAIEARQTYSSQAGGAVDTTTFEYDSQFNQLIATENSQGQKLAYEIDSDNGNVVSSRVIVGQDDRGSNESDDVVTSFVYTDSGLVDYSVDALGRTMDYDYDSYGRLISETFADGSAESGTVRYEYDDLSGNVTARIDENGNRIEYQYDVMNRLMVTSSDDPDGAGPQSASTSQFGYDAAGNLTVSIDGNGNRTRYEYDKRNRQSAIIDAAGEQATFVYDSEGNLTLSRDFRGKSTRYQYNALHRMTSMRDAAGGSTRFTYDKRGLVTSETDARGSTTAFEYDSRGRVVLSVDALGESTTFSYDTAGNLASITDANGNRTRYLYDDLNRQTASIDHLGNRVSLEYDKLGKLTSQTDQRGNTTTFEYDERDRLVRTMSADGSFATYAYDSVGNMVSQTDELGRTTSFTYNSLNQLVATEDALGGQLTYTYDGAGNLVSTQDRRQQTTRFEYDKLNRLVKQVDALAGETTFSYDAGGNLVGQTDALGNSTTSAYDALNRLTFVTNQEGDSISYRYDAVGNVTSTRDELGHTATAEYDAANQLIRSTDALGQSVSYAYDAVGNITATTDELGRTTSSEYDKLNRLIATFNADGKAIRFGYDETGNIVSITDELGRTSTSNYDARNRLVESTNAVGDSVVYTYDAVGNRLSTEDELGRVTTNTYDWLDRLVSVTNADGSEVQFAYDASGNLVTVEDELGRVTSNAYDPLNRLVKTVNAAGDSARFAYDAVGNLLTQQDELGRVTAYSYDSLYRLVETQNALGGTVKYGYDVAGNLIEVEDEGGNTTSNTYDKLDRLVESRNALGGSVKFTYDAVGNRIATEDELGRVTQFSYDSLDRLSETTNAVGDTASYSYDAAGNLLSYRDELGRVTSNGYDDLNRLTQTTNAAGDSASYIYDAVGNLLSSEDELGRVTRYAYDNLNQLAETTNALGGTVGYTYDLAGNRVGITNERGHTSVVEYDELNRIVKSTNALGHSDTFTYDAVGNLIATEDGLERVTSNQYDNLNRLVETTNAAGKSSSFEYDASGNLLKATDELGRENVFGYDALNRQIVSTNAANDSVYYAYDAVGNVVAYRDELGRVSYSEYDDLDRLSKSIDPAGGSINFEYDSVGNLIIIRDQNGFSTSNDFDELNQLIKTTDAMGGETLYSYDAVGNQTSIADELGRENRNTFDALNRVIETRDPMGGRTQYAYDLAGNIISVQDALGRVTRNSYDKENQLLSTTDPLDGVIEYTYDAVGNIESIENQLNHTTRFEYDALNRQIKVIQPLSLTTSMSYDAVGNLLSVRSAQGETTSYEYDVLDRQTHVQNSNATTLDYTYTKTGKVASFTDESNDTTTYQYDSRDNLIKETNKVGDSRSYTYDSRNNLVRRVDRNGRAIEYKYDALNRMIRERWIGGNSNVIEYKYDAADQLQRISDNFSSYKYTYNSNGQITKESNSSSPYSPSLVSEMNYDAVGNLISTNMSFDGYSVSSSNSYNDNNQITRSQQSGSFGSSKSGRYTYDAAGQLTNYVVSSGSGEQISGNHEYDAAGRLEKTTTRRVNNGSDSTSVTEYEYEQVSTHNSTSSNSSSNSDPDKVYDPFGRLIEDGNTVYTYDKEGNLVRIRAKDWGGSTVYEYDHRNREILKSEPNAYEDWGDGYGEEPQPIYYDVYNRMLFTSESDWIYPLRRSYSTWNLHSILGASYEKYIRSVSEDCDDCDSYNSDVDRSFSFSAPQVGSLGFERISSRGGDSNSVSLSAPYIKQDSVASRVESSQTFFNKKGDPVGGIINAGLQVNPASASNSPESNIFADVLGVIFSETVDASQEATRDSIDFWVDRANDPNANGFQQAYYTANGSFASILGRVVGLDIDFTGADAVAYYADRYNDPNASFLERSVYAVAGSFSALGTNRNVVTEAAEDYVEYSAAQFISSDTNILQKSFYGLTGLVASPFTPENISTTTTTVLAGAAVLANPATLLGHTILVADRVVNASDVAAGAGGILNGEYTVGNFLSLIGLRELRGVDDFGRAARNLDKLDDVARAVDDVDNTVARAVSDSTPRRVNDASEAIADNTRSGRATSQTGAFDSAGRGPNRGVVDGAAADIIAPQQEAAQRVAEALRFRILGSNLEQGGRFSVIEALGGTRIEKVIGRRLNAPVVNGVVVDGIDFIDSGNLGRIQLKGPFLNDSLVPLTPNQQQAAINSVLRKIQTNTAPDTFIIDTLGLPDNLFNSLRTQVQALPQASKVRFLR